MEGTRYKPGQRSGLFYAVREYNGRKDHPKGFGWHDVRDLIVRVRIQLGGPIVLVWDNARLHLTKLLREFIDKSADWLTFIQLPTYAPVLNPTEGIWSLVKRDIGNLAAADLSQNTRVVKHRLKQLQCRPDVIDGCLARTGLALAEQSSEAADEAMPLAGPLDMPMQLARPHAHDDPGSARGHICPYGDTLVLTGVPCVPLAHRVAESFSSRDTRPSNSAPVAPRS
ncbi:transposase [Streptomyces sp. NPDC029554]|uniref:transposase n=1 Tax=Streptomyces sp. NPDC029554 TaxID=3155126 RepID=UPI0033E4AEF4